MLRVTVDSADVQSRPWEMEGRKGVSRTQTGWLHIGKRYPIEVTIKLGERQAYEPGEYVVGPGSFFVNGRDIVIRLSDLVRAPAAASRAA